MATVEYRGATIIENGCCFCDGYAFTFNLDSGSRTMCWPTIEETKRAIDEELEELEVKP